MVRKSRIKPVQPKVTARRNQSKAKTPSHTPSTVDIILADCDPKSLSGLDWLASGGHYISGDDLAGAIEVNPGRPLPDRLRNYLCQFLRGKIKRKPGPSNRGAEFTLLIELLAAEEYRRELQRLQKEVRVRGRDARAQGILPPHEQAIEIVKKRFSVRFSDLNSRRVANIISSRS
jgi:hypothetical protein